MKVFKIVALTVFSLFLIACGGKEEKKKEGFTYEKKSATGVSEKVESKTSDVNTDNSTAITSNDIVITGNDVMQFSKKEIKVSAGKKVKITLKHIGKLDKNVMGHNFVLLKPGVDLVAFGNKAATERDNNYIPKGTQDVIVHTKMLGAGETDVIEFDAPEAGTYEFLCSFPGHSIMMKGKFIVE